MLNVKTVFRKAFSTRFVGLRLKDGTTINAIILNKDFSRMSITVLDVTRYKTVLKIGYNVDIAKALSTYAVVINTIESVNGDRANWLN